jgi:predicted 2-oxoglutarate/Fe(II)-dependent dioxygenase YbiX
MDRDPAQLVDVCGLDLTQPLLWTVPTVLSASECRDFIARIEASQPTPAPITTSGGFVMRPEVRNNSRVLFDDRRLAAELFERLVAHLPKSLLRMHAVGVNERFRCYRYQPGQRFALHHDGTFARSPKERSLLTLLIYLNQDFSGGETAFPEEGERIRPQTGLALLFQHRLLHEGCAVRSGVKYALRSDIMYRSPI